MTNDKCTEENSRSVTKYAVVFFSVGFANSDVHFVEGDQPTMYANAPG